MIENTNIATTDRMCVQPVFPFSEPTYVYALPEVTSYSYVTSNTANITYNTIKAGFSLPATLCVALRAGSQNSEATTTQHTSSHATMTTSAHNYYGYRYYSTDLGRWINRDPIQERGGLNVYGFVDNEPVSRIDMWGLSAAGTVAMTIWMPIVESDFLMFKRKWLMELRWDPPTDGDWALSCECKPCQKAVWIQDARWHVVIPGLPDINEDWHNEWDEDDYHDYTTAWSCREGEGASGMAVTADEPGLSGLTASLSVFSSYTFEAFTYLKCVDGDDAGTVYAAVIWGTWWDYSDDEVHAVWNQIH